MKIKRFNEKIETGHATIGDTLGSADLIIGFSENEYKDIFDDDFVFDDTNLYSFEGGYCIYFYDPNSGRYMNIDKTSPLTDLIFVYKNDDEFPVAVFRVSELSAVNYFNKPLTMIGREIAKFYDTTTWYNHDEVTF